MKKNTATKPAAIKTDKLTTVRTAVRAGARGAIPAYI